MQQRKWITALTPALSLLLSVFLCAGCGSTEPPITGPGGAGGNRGPESGIGEGQVGLVIDTREISKKGYVPTRVELSFDDHADRNTTLDVGERTNLAIFAIDDDSLSDEEREAFGNGVALSLAVFDETDTELVRISDDSARINNSNRPFLVDTDLPYIKRPLSLKEGVPYLFQVEGKAGVLGSFCSACFETRDFEVDSTAQQFFVAAVDGKEDTFLVEHFGYAEGTYWYPEVGVGFINLNGNAVPLPSGGASEFVFEQDDDGWIKIRIEGTSDYLTLVRNEIFYGTTETPDRFRLISDDIDWDVEDLGTEFTSPILPPPRVDFALQPTPLDNCTSPGTTTLTVGVNKTKTQSTTVGTSESLEFFSSEKLSLGMKVGFEAGADVQGIGSIKSSVEVSAGYELTNSTTSRSENRLEETVTEEIETAIQVEQEVPPFSKVIVTETLYSLDDVRTPFVQVFRVSGTYKGTGDDLTGAEIASQMLFNFFGGVVTRYDSEFIEITVRGQATINQIVKLDVKAEGVPCD